MKKRLSALILAVTTAAITLTGCGTKLHQKMYLELGWKQGMLLLIGLN